MLNVYLCHAAEDREIANQIALRLESTAECRVLQDPIGNIPANWDGGLACSAILLLLSPSSVPPRVSREEWEALLQHLSGHQEPPVALIAVRDGPWPKLLERRAFYRWTEPSLHVLRALERFVIAAHPAANQTPFQAAKLDWLPHSPQLESLWAALVDRCGAIAVTGPKHCGKSALAQQLAHDAREHFRDVLWIGCGDRSLKSLACEIAANVGTVLEGEIEQASRQLAGQIAAHRLLLVLDDVLSDVSCLIPKQGRVSTLVTTRDGDTVPSLAKMTLRAPRDQSAAAPTNDATLRLWQAMSACCAANFPLDVAAEAAGISSDKASVGARMLAASRHIHPLDAAGVCYRLVIPHPSPLVAEHAAATHRIFRQWVTDPNRCMAAVREVPHAVRWGLAHDWSLASDLGRWAFALLRVEKRGLEAAELLEPLAQEAERRGDGKTAEDFRWELSWIRTAGDAQIKLPNVEATQLSLF